MTWEIAFVLLLTVGVFAAMVWEKLPTDLVALLTLSVLMLTRILTPAEAFQIFSNDAPITIAAMFILSAALDRTGAIERIAHRLDRLTGRSDWTLLLVMLPMVALISAFVNNTPVVAVFMPIMITLAARRNLTPSKLLMPLSFAAIFGGCCTLIGTSTNILVSSTAAKLGQPPLRMFELTPIGAIMAGAGLLYLLTLGRRWLPERETLASVLQQTDSKEYLTEAVIVAGSPLIGRRVADTPLKSLPNAHILEIARSGESFTTALDEVVLELGDRLRLTTVPASVMEIKGLRGIEILPHANLGLAQVAAEKAVTVESVVAPTAEFIGKTIKEINLQQRFGVLILAVHRAGQSLRQHFENVRLRFGDTILMEGSHAAINKLREDRNFLLLADVPHKVARREKRWIAMLTIALVVTLAALNVWPIAALALCGALAVVLTGCLEAERAYEAIDWRILFLIFGMLSLGLALEKTGAAEFIASGLLRGLGWMGPVAILSVVYLVTSLLTEFLSNNVVAVLLTPIVLSTAEALGVEARPFIVAVALGASASFATPIGYQTNTLVYGAGGYQFRDFLKVGAPLNVLFWVLATILIPLFWPLK
jgi:di/tricarboxylate transporter